MSAALSEGGAENLRRVLRWAASGEAVVPEELPVAGEHGVASASPGWGRAAIVFYRSHLQAGDAAPIEALAEALAARGLAVRAFYAASPKEPGCAAGIGDELRAWGPSVWV